MADDKTFTQADLDAAIAKVTDKFEESVGKLESKNAELIADLRKARKSSEIKPEDLQAAEERADKAEAKVKELETSVKALTTERDKATKALEAESGFSKSLLIERDLTGALLKGGVKDEDYLDALVNKFSQGVQVVADGDKRKIMAGDKELSAVVTEYLGSDSGKKFVAAPNNGGGGAGGGGGSATGKTMLRSQFEALDAAARMAFSKEGGKLVDQAA